MNPCSSTEAVWFYVSNFVFLHPPGEATIEQFKGSSLEGESKAREW